MSTEHELYDQDTFADEALDAVREDPFAGEDPDDDYLEAEAERRMVWHEEQEHAGDPCNCQAAPVVYAEQAPF